MLTPTKLMKMAKAATVLPWLVMDMFNAGLLEPALRPMIAKGSRRYLGAIQAGDIASVQDDALREVACKKCPARTFATSPGGVSGWEFEWCGVPLVELGAGERAAGNPGADRPEWAHVDWDGVIGPACGCLLDLKRKVASERCPRGEWGAVTPVSLTVGGGAASG